MSESTPEAAPEAPAQPAQQAVATASEPPASHEAPGGIALFDAFAEPVETPAAETITHTPEPTADETAPDAAPVRDAIEAARQTPVENPPEAIVPPQAEPTTAAMVEPSPAPTEPPVPHQHPLRFLWQMDAEGRFVLGSDEFIRLIGPHTAAGFGRPWREIADAFALDPDGRVAQALASHDTWAGITVNWPADGGEHVPVELAGLPVYDRERNFAGFKGFGVCRDLDGLNRLDALRRYEQFVEPPAQHDVSTDVVEREPEPEAEPPPPPGEPPPPTPEPEAELPEPVTEANSHPTDLETPVETPPNVLPFRQPGDARAPTLTPVENSAFNELARQLSERLEREKETIAAVADEPPTAEITPEPA